MIRQMIALEVVEVETQPPHAYIEQRLKKLWEDTSSPHCGHNIVHI